MSSLTPLQNQGLIEGKSPATAAFHHVHQTSGHAVSSPARMLMMSSPSNANIPSPATFAKLAAAVGVQNPLDDTAKSSVSADATMSNRARDPLTALLNNADAVHNDHLVRLEKAGNLFFDEYENALDVHSDSRRVVKAHRDLLAVYDQLMIFATQSGLAAIPCVEEGSISQTKMESLDDLQSKLTEETKLSFERRERLREGASMVTSILLQGPTTL